MNIVSKDYNYRNSQLLNKLDYTNEWFELIEIEEAIFENSGRHELTMFLMEMNKHEKAKYYELSQIRWLASIK